MGNADEEDTSSVKIKQRQLFSTHVFFKGFGRPTHGLFPGLHTSAWRHFAGTGRTISRPLWYSSTIRVHA